MLRVPQACTYDTPFCQGPAEAINTLLLLLLLLLLVFLSLSHASFFVYLVLMYVHDTASMIPDSVLYSGIRVSPLSAVLCFLLYSSRTEADWGIGEIVHSPCSISRPPAAGDSTIFLPDAHQKAALCPTLPTCASEQLISVQEGGCASPQENRPIHGSVLKSATKVLQYSYVQQLFFSKICFSFGSSPDLS